MRTRLYSFLADERGQDLVEYTLLLAFVCLGSAALFNDTAISISRIWSLGDVQLSAAARSAGGGGTPTCCD